MRKVSSLKDVSVAVDRLTTQIDYDNIVKVKDKLPEITIVADDIGNVDIVAGIDIKVVELANRKDEIDSLYADKVVLDTLYADKSNIDIVATNIGNVNTVGNEIVKVNNYYDTYLGEGATNPTVRRDNTALQEGDLFFNTADSLMLVYDGISWKTFSKTAIHYGVVPPSASINPEEGNNALYVDTHLNDLYYCVDATADANVWVKYGGGQFSDNGTPIGSGVGYTAQVSAIEDIVIKAGTNGFSIDSFELVDGASLTIEDGAVYKIL